VWIYLQWRVLFVFFLFPKQHLCLAGQKVRDLVLDRTIGSRRSRWWVSFLLPFFHCFLLPLTSEFLV